MVARQLVIGVTLAAVGVLAAAAPSGARTDQVAKPKPAPYGSIFVVNAPGENGTSETGPASIEEFAPGAHGNVAPVARIAGSTTRLGSPGQIALLASGWLVVAEASTNEIDEYAPGAHGNVAPARRIVGSLTRLSAPHGLAVTRTGAIWVTSVNSDMTLPGKLLEFAPGAHGNVAPTRVITGSRTNLQEAAGIAISPDGKHLWVTHSGETYTGWNEAAMEEFSTSSRGNVTPQRLITGSNIKIQFPEGVAVMPSGAIVVSSIEYASVSAGALTTFGPKANHNARPPRLVYGAKTGLEWAEQISLDAKRNIWVASFRANSVERFAPTANGNVRPTRRIAGPATRLAGPEAVVVYLKP